MASTTDDDEIGLMVMRSFHNGFSRVSLQMLQFVVNLKVHDVRGLLFKFVDFPSCSFNTAFIQH